MAWRLVARRGAGGSGKRDVRVGFFLSGAAAGGWGPVVGDGARGAAARRSRVGGLGPWTRAP